MVQGLTEGLQRGSYKKEGQDRVSGSEDPGRGRRIVRGGGCRTVRRTH